MQLFEHIWSLIVVTANTPPANNLLRRKLGSTQLHASVATIYCSIVTGVVRMGSKQAKFEEDTMKEFEVSLCRAGLECWFRHTAVTSTVDFFLFIGSYSIKQS